MVVVFALDVRVVREVSIGERVEGEDVGGSAAQRILEYDAGVIDHVGGQAVGGTREAEGNRDIGSRRSRGFGQAGGDIHAVEDQADLTGINGRGGGGERGCGKGDAAGGGIEVGPGRRGSVDDLRNARQAVRGGRRADGCGRCCSGTEVIEGCIRYAGGVVAVSVTQSAQPGPPTRRRGQERIKAWYRPREVPEGGVTTDRSERSGQVLSVIDLGGEVCACTLKSQPVAVSGLQRPFRNSGYTNPTNIGDHGGVEVHAAINYPAYPDEASARSIRITRRDRCSRIGVLCIHVHPVKASQAAPANTRGEGVEVRGDTSGQTKECVVGALIEIRLPVQQVRRYIKVAIDLVGADRRGAGRTEALGATGSEGNETLHPQGIPTHCVSRERVGGREIGTVDEGPTGRGV